MKSDLYIIRLFAAYESKLVFRSWLFRVLVLLSILAIWIAQYILQYMMPKNTSIEWHMIALSVSVPFLNLYLFTIIQSLLVLFAVKEWYGNEKNLDTIQVIYTRPVSSMDILLGKSLGIVLVFLLLNLFSLAGAVCFNIFISYSPFSWYVYFFYLVTLSLPVLIFFLGLSIWVFYFFKNQYISLFLLLCIFLFSLLFLPDSLHGLLDPRATNVPNVFSDIVGHVDLGVYLSQRLFFFFSGIGLLCFSVGKLNRLTDYRESVVRVKIIALVCIALGGLSGYYYGHLFGERDRVREEYRAVALKYQELPVVDLLEQHLTYKTIGNTMAVSSILTIRNAGDAPVDKIIFYLNPFLKVTSLREGNREVPFSREGQCIVISRFLPIGDMLTFEMSYEGKIDERVCYLDVQDEEYNRKRLDGSFLRFGKQYAFLGEDYTFLIPECLWYPVSVAPANLTNPYATRKNFTRYSLKVITPEGKEVISQGTEEWSGDTIVFYNKHNLTGISLCIGEYERRSIRLDSIDVSLYLVKGHGDFFSTFDSLSTELPGILTDVKRKIEAARDGEYPFDKFSMIEVPISFTSYTRQWKNNDFTQPEMLFFPERWFTQTYWAIWMKSDYLVNKQNQVSFLDRLPELFAEQTYTLGEHVYKLLLLNKYARMAPMQIANGQSLSPLFSDYSSCFFSAEYPIIDKVMKNLQSLSSNHVNKMFVLGSTYSFSDRLFTSSFKNLLEDKTISEQDIEGIVQLKTFHLLNYITSFITYEEFQSFLNDYVTRFSYSEINFHDFIDKLNERFGVNMDDFLSDWYLEDQIPEFRFTDETLQEYNTEKGTYYVFSIKAYNPSAKEGILSVKMGATPLKNYLLKGKSCYLVRVNGLLMRPPTLTMLYTNVSRNIPKLLMYNFGGKTLIEASDTSSGIFAIDATDFNNSDNEIIVDNVDPGCQAIQYDERSRLSALFAKKEKKRIEYRSIIPRFEGDFSSFWAEDFSPYDYFGDIVKSIYYKISGEGNYKIEWEAKLREGGVYEVFIYNIRNPFITESDEQYYVLRHCDGEEQIKLATGKLAPGWVSVGTFRFKAGEAKMTLNDKGAYAGQRVCADAVKWVKVKE